MRSAAEDTAVEAVFMAAVEVDSTEVARFAVAADLVADTAAVALSVVAGLVEDIAAATSMAHDLMVEALTEAARLGAAGALPLVDLAGSDAASMAQLAEDSEVATDTALAMRSRTATGILLEVLEAP